MVKSMYPKTVTETIIEDWGKGASAEETRKHLQDLNGKAPCINTIYAHRKGLTAQDLLNQLIIQQQRGITKQDRENPELALRFRDNLIKTLYPQMNINLNRTEQTNKTEITINVPELLKQYEDLLEEATILENCAPQPLHPPKTNREAGPVSST